VPLGGTFEIELEQFPRPGTPASVNAAARPEPRRSTHPSIARRARFASTRVTAATSASESRNVAGGSRWWPSDEIPLVGRVSVAVD